MAWLPLREAAEAVGITRDALRGRADRGLWRTEQSGGRRVYWVDEDGEEDRDLIPQYDPPTRSPRASDGPRVAIVCSDVHIPEHDPVAWGRFIDCVRDAQPDDVVLAGDILELESCSQHGGVAQPALFVEEIQAARRELERVREAAPRASITYLEGNHETRLSRLTVARVPTIQGALDIPTQLDLASLGIRWQREGDPLHLGRLSVVHGWWANKHHAAKHTEAMGCSVLYGHTHRPQFHIAGTRSGLRGGFGNGCLRTLDPGWMTGRPTGWMHGFSVVHYWPDGEFQVTPILLTPGRRFSALGRVYG